MLPDFPHGTLVKLTGRGLALHRKLSAWHTSGIDFAGSVLSADEAVGSFTWLGTDNGREAVVRSEVSGREGMLSRSLLKRA
jgi:hypothetical protein